MKTQITFKGCLLVTVSLASLVGCGGSNIVPNLNLSGTYVESPNSHNTTITISGNGNVTGRSENFSLGGTDILTGTVNPDGSLFGKVENDRNASYSFTVSGTMKFGVNTNKLMVNYTGTYSGAPITTDLVLTRSGF